MTEPNAINNREDKRPVLVIAGYHHQYKDFLHKHGLNPQQYRFVNRPDQIMGMRDAYYILTGQYWMNPVYENRRELFQVYNIKELKEPLHE